MINLSEDRILDFLDGRLATPDEEELLHTLAVSPERRQVMREHMKLRELTSTIARQDRFSVPESVTAQLFNRLEEAGFTPPVTPESLLGLPQAASMKYAGAATALGAGTLATAVSSGWRFGMIGLLTASVMSFVLGAGAYYVFGSELGLRTHSQELAALQHSRMHHVTPGLASQFAVSQNNVAASTPVAGNASSEIAKHSAGGSVAANNLVVSNASLVGSLPIGLMGHISPIANAEIAQASTLATSSDNDATTPIGYTAPKQETYAMTTDEMRFLNGPPPIMPNAVPTPFADERGTVSVRYGTGEAPSSTSSNMSSLNEFRFGMTTWNYVLWRASIGYMTSYERVAQIATAGPSKGEIITPESSTPTNTTLVGLETGVTLDPIGVPIDALVGFMWSGGGAQYQDGSEEYSPFYGRASLMAHFEPWQKLEISAGFEGLLYTHYLDGAIASHTLFPAAVSSTVVRSETSGFVGPALELGWHF
jgi:hypothetical protein